MERLPLRSWSVPSWSQTVGPGPTAHMIGSSRDTSTTWPSPLPPGRSRCHSAIIVAEDAVMPAMESASPIEGRVGWAVGLPGDGREARHGLGEGSEAGPRAVGPVLAETGDPDQHEPRVESRAARPNRCPSAPGCRGGSSR